MKKNINIIGLILITVVLSSCADSVNVSPCLNNVELVGFWYGVWHGMISQFAFIGTLFSDEIAVYAINNNGWPYDFGFVFGLGIVVKIFAYIINVIRGI